jgi:hypothetical protein
VVYEGETVLARGMAIPRAKPQPPCSVSFATLWLANHTQREAIGAEAQAPRRQRSYRRGVAPLQECAAEILMFAAASLKGAFGRGG